MPVSPSLIDRRTAPLPGRPGPALVTPWRVVGTVGSAVLRAAAAAASGLLLVGGLGLLLWAVTPGSGSDATGILGGGVVAFAAAHFLPVSIGSVAVTVHPLLLTLILVAAIASSAGRARPVRGRTLEALHAAVFAVAYAVLVRIITGALAPADVVVPGILAPLCLAMVGAVLGVALHRTAWNRWWRRAVPAWLHAGLSAGMAAVCLLLAAGALAVTVGMLTSFSDATAIGRMIAPSAGDGFGLFLLSLAFLPNAVIAGVGYVSGAGFGLGAGSYSPLAVHATELPAIPLLAAAPDGAEPSRLALAAFAAPLAAAVLVAVIACRRLELRRDRIVASALASVVAGLVVAGLAAVAGGGVAGGPWESTGVPSLLAGGLVAGVLLVISGTWSAAAGLRTVAWAPPRTKGDPAGLDVEEAGGDGAGGDETDGDGVTGDGAPEDASDDRSSEDGEADTDTTEPGGDVTADTPSTDDDAGPADALPATPDDSVTDGSADPGDDDSVTDRSSDAVADGTLATAAAADPAGDDRPFPDAADNADRADDPDAPDSGLRDAG